MAARIIVTPEFVDLDHPLIARALLRHIVEHADIVSQDHKGRAVMRFEFAAEPWMIDKLAALGTKEEYLEDDDPAEEEPDLEDDELEEEEAYG
jgi:hypothetical protein